MVVTKALLKSDKEKKFKMKSILCSIVLLTIALTAKTCLKDADCFQTECCAENNVCMKYLDVGNACPLRSPAILL